MKKFCAKKMAVVLAAIVLLASCGVSFAAEGFTVTDVMGREVSFERRPERIVVANYIFNFLLVGGGESLSRVVGMTKDGWQDTRYGEYTVLTEAFPSIKEIASIGGYHDDVLDTERIIELAPEVMLIGRSQFTENETRIPVWEKSGIRVVVIDYHRMTIENDVRSTEIIGRLLGREEVAAELCEAYRSGIEDTLVRVAKIPAERKGTRAYIEIGSMGVGTLGNSWAGALWGAILDNVGADNIANGALESSWGPLDAEHILARDPQVIFIGGSIWAGDVNSDQMRMGFTVSRELAASRLEGFAKRPMWGNIDAIKNGRVYGVDHGAVRNILDHAFTRWIAKVLYPEYFEDIDPAADYEAALARYLPEVRGDRVFMIELGR